MISLVIPCYHADEDTIQLTKNCLDSLRFGRPDEVILVDDASPIIKNFSQDVNIQIFRNKNGGFGKACNTGFKQAKGDIIICSNNDITFMPGWLEAILKPLEMGYDVSSIRVTDSDGYTTENKITEGDKFGSLWAMKREVYDTIGGFDEEFGIATFEDLDFHQRVNAAGFKVGKNHAVGVEHVGRATLDKLYPNGEYFEEGKKIYRRKYGRVD